MKAKGTKNISFTQRLQLEAYLRAGLHKKTIASKLGLCLATVYNEIQRGAYEHTNSDLTTEMRYSPNLAEDKYRVNQTSKGAPIKLGKDHDF
ncbi:MAG: IS30 family transposase, partial [Firmicutes bacterium]|nr:IS30 family transposase [Bacillota bacterium]